MRAWRVVCSECLALTHLTQLRVSCSWSELLNLFAAPTGHSVGGVAVVVQLRWWWCQSVLLESLKVVHTKIKI